jgi:hypothetical protein
MAMTESQDHAPRTPTACGDCGNVFDLASVDDCPACDTRERIDALANRVEDLYDIVDRIQSTIRGDTDD